MSLLRRVPSEPGAGLRSARRELSEAHVHGVDASVPRARTEPLPPPPPSSLVHVPSIANYP